MNTWAIDKKDFGYIAITKRIMDADKNIILQNRKEICVYQLCTEEFNAVLQNTLNDIEKEIAEKIAKDNVKT